MEIESIQSSRVYRINLIANLAAPIDDMLTLMMWKETTCQSPTISDRAYHNIYCHRFWLFWRPFFRIQQKSLYTNVRIDRKVQMISSQWDEHSFLFCKQKDFVPKLFEVCFPAIPGNLLEESFFKWLTRAPKNHEGSKTLPSSKVWTTPTTLWCRRQECGWKNGMPMLFVKLSSFSWVMMSPKNYENFQLELYGVNQNDLQNSTASLWPFQPCVKKSIPLNEKDAPRTHGGPGIGEVAGGDDWTHVATTFAAHWRSLTLVRMVGR